MLLALAIDVSRSVTDDEAVLQRDGYRGAMTDPAVLAAIAGGPVGAIGVAYFEWARYDFQDLILPWTRIAGRADAQAWSDRLGAIPRQKRVVDEHFRRAGLCRAAAGGEPVRGDAAGGGRVR